MLSTESSNLNIKFFKKPILKNIIMIKLPKNYLEIEDMKFIFINNSNNYFGSNLMNYRVKMSY